MAGGHHTNYLLIFIALCICTALSVVADIIHLDNKILLITIVLAIATAKALFVMTYFMHLKFEGAWKFVLLAPTMILAMGLPLALLPGHRRALLPDRCAAKPVPGDGGTVRHVPRFAASTWRNERERRGHQRARVIPSVRRTLGLG